MKRRTKVLLTCLAAPPIAVGLWIVVVMIMLLIPQKVTDDDAPFWFRKLVCDQMPISVTNLTVTGVSKFTGDSLQLTFHASQEDLAVIVQSGSFVPWGGPAGDVRGMRWMSEGLTNPQVFLKRRAPVQVEYIPDVTLVIETNRGIARVDYVRP